MMRKYNYMFIPLLGNNINILLIRFECFYMEWNKIFLEQRL